MNYKEIYNQWKTDKFFDEAIHCELASIVDEKEIEDRFYKNLEFGTGGLRGIMGAGTNRMNKYTVGRATLGLANYLLNKYGEKVCENRGVAIGYDTRNNSAFFAKVAADVLSGKGIRVFLHAFPRPTPELSFSVKYWNALAGVVITASHNPKEYNGYKVYDEYGGQLVPKQAEEVISFVNDILDYRNINFGGDPALITIADPTDKFVVEVMKQSRYKNKDSKNDLKIVYTPLHGTGNVPVQQILKTDGFNHLDNVPEQTNENGDFPTVVSPNPEDRRALELGISQAKNLDSDIVLGTDPDCDRVGVAVKTEEGYKLITGNQMGALLTDFILNNSEITSLYKPAIVKTVVTSDLGAEIAKKYGLTVFSTLTGFKYIGEKITQFEQAREKNNESQDYTFVFGYEESYGYLAGTHARDKDAVVACLLICEMAASLKAQGKTIVDRLNEIYKEYGYYLDALDSFTLKGKQGLESISAMMFDLRSHGSPFDGTAQIIDFNSSVEAEPGFGCLPASNVLKYILNDGSWVAIRPSGTEPKIKIYYSIKAETEDVAKIKFKSIQQIIQSKMKLN